MYLQIYVYMCVQMYYICLYPHANYSTLFPLFLGLVFSTALSLLSTELEQGELEDPNGGCFQAA